MVPRALFTMKNTLMFLVWLIGALIIFYVDPLLFLGLTLYNLAMITSIAADVRAYVKRRELWKAYKGK